MTMNLIQTKTNENITRDARQRRSIRDFDRYLTGGLIVVAATAAALPWYVFFNPEKFGISGNGWEALKHVPQRQGGGLTSVMPHDKNIAPDTKTDAASLEVDPLTTATLPTSGTGESRSDSGASQPFPGGTRFKLLHVSNGRALIEDKSGMFLVQIGSVLPDDSRLLSMNNVNGKWQIVTSAGEVYAE